MAETDVKHGQFLLRQDISTSQERDVDTKTTTVMTTSVVNKSEEEHSA